MMMVCSPVLKFGENMIWDLKLYVFRIRKIKKEADSKPYSSRLAESVSTDVTGHATK
jgi:hypothetical protein